MRKRYSLSKIPYGHVDWRSGRPCVPYVEAKVGRLRSQGLPSSNRARTQLKCFFIPLFINTVALARCQDREKRHEPFQRLPEIARKSLTLRFRDAAVDTRAINGAQIGGDSRKNETGHKSIWGPRTFQPDNQQNRSRLLVPKPDFGPRVAPWPWRSRTAFSLSALRVPPSAFGTNPTNSHQIPV
jgi:hypothetical protein